MKKRWTTVLELRLDGDRFADKAIDLLALGELVEFQNIFAKLAKEVWKRQHTARKRAPKDFDSAIRLCIRRIKRGSTILPLEIRPHGPQQTDLFVGSDSVVRQAAELLHLTVDAAKKGRNLPESVPREILHDLAAWWHFDSPKESVSILVGSKAPARYDSKTQEQIYGVLAQPYQDHVDLIGRVYEADVLAGRFRLLLPGDRKIPVTFTHDQEEDVTTALKDHRERELRIKGTGLFSASGNLMRIDSVSKMILGSPGESLDQQSVLELRSRPIWEELDDIARLVPSSEWNRLPRDLSDRIDDYLYGSYAE